MELQWFGEQEDLWFRWTPHRCHPPPAINQVRTKVKHPMESATPPSHRGVWWWLVAAKFIGLCGQISSFCFLFHAEQTFCAKQLWLVQEPKKLQRKTCICQLFWGGGRKRTTSLQAPWLPLVFVVEKDLEKKHIIIYTILNLIPVEIAGYASLSVVPVERKTVKLDWQLRDFKNDKIMVLFSNCTSLDWSESWPIFNTQMANMSFCLDRPPSIREEKEKNRWTNERLLLGFVAPSFAFLCFFFLGGGASLEGKVQLALETARRQRTFHKIRFAKTRMWFFSVWLKELCNYHAEFKQKSKGMQIASEHTAKKLKVPGTSFTVHIFNSLSWFLVINLS